MSLRFSATQKLQRTANLPQSTNFTICGWARRRADRGTYSTLCSVELTTSSKFIAYQTNTNGDSLVVFTDLANGGTIATLTNDTWFFWAITCSGTGSNNVTYYFALATATSLSSVTTSSSNYAPNQVNIGDDSFTEQWNGNMQNVIMYSGVLTSAQLLAQMRRSIPLFGTNLNIYSPLLSTADETIDYSGNGRNWTKTGTFTTEDSAPIVSPFQGRTKGRKQVVVSTTAKFRKTFSGIGTGIGKRQMMRS